MIYTAPLHQLLIFRRPDDHDVELYEDAIVRAFQSIGQSKSPVRRERGIAAPQLSVIGASSRSSPFSAPRVAVCLRVREVSTCRDPVARDCRRFGRYRRLARAQASGIVKHDASLAEALIVQEHLAGEEAHRGREKKAR